MIVVGGYQVKPLKFWKVVQKLVKRVGEEVSQLNQLLEFPYKQWLVIEHQL